MDALHLGDLVGKPIDIAEPNTFEVQGSGVSFYLSGFGFTYDSNNQPLGGVATQIDFRSPSGGFSGSLPFVPVVNFEAWALSDSTQLAFSAVLAGNDRLFGNDGDNLIRGFGGDDVIVGDLNQAQLGLIAVFGNEFRIKGDDLRPRNDLAKIP